MVLKLVFFKLKTNWNTKIAYPRCLNFRNVYGVRYRIKANHRIYIKIGFIRTSCIKLLDLAVPPVTPSSIIRQMPHFFAHWNYPRPGLPILNNERVYQNTIFRATLTSVSSKRTHDMDFYSRMSDYFCSSSSDGMVIVEAGA